MMRIASVIGLTLVFHSSAIAAGPSVQDFTPEAIEFFEKQVRPLLAEKCWDCHGDTKPKGRLRLTSRAGILEGGASGPAAVAGKPAQSLLLKAIRHEQEDLQMPPKGKLTERQIEMVERWIRLGLPWPASVAKKPASDAPGGAAHWAFQPVKVAPLTWQDKGWAKNPVDHYILSGLENQGLKPAARASKEALLRRVTLDLLGLPPTPAELDAFLKDDSPQAFAKVVDRLLASPHYGERWARHWLDLVRYADDLGRVSGFKEIWLYRDWVTTAFNEDMPYTEFIKLQLAGDLLLPENPARGAVATGVLAIAQFDTDSQNEQQNADCVEDMVDVVGRAFMGLTISCARCHDHKFDPISTEDYYSLAGIFFNIRVTEALNVSPSRIRLPLATPAEQELAKKLNKQKGELEKEIRVLQKTAKAAKEPMPELEKQIKDKMQQVQQLTKQMPPARPSAVVAREGGHKKSRYSTFQDAPILIRGDPMKPGKVVPRGFPKVLTGALEKPVSEGSGRRELVDWLTRPNHPLTARVMVNRIWQHHMGAGIVRTPNNFGAQGDRPTHPELLDFLADYFVRSGWSIKAVHRLILNSAVYQQSSIPPAETLAQDPDNRLWGRMNRRRLDAEALRDSLLALAGTLDPAIGGMGTDKLESPRRTHYFKTLRSERPSDFSVLFDRPDPSLISDGRSESTLATQSLFMLNDPFVLAQVKALAGRLEKELPEPRAEARIQYLFRLILGRSPLPAEIDIGQELLRQVTPANANAWERYIHLLLCTNEFLYVD